MSLSMQPLPEIPTLTVEITRPAFPTGRFYMKTRNELGSFYQDEGFSACYAARRQPGLAPWRLSLVARFQFVKGLSDKQVDRTFLNSYNTNY